jgi:hypothetical protein
MGKDHGHGGFSRQGKGTQQTAEQSHCCVDLVDQIQNNMSQVLEYSEHVADFSFMVLAGHSQTPHSLLYLEKHISVWKRACQALIHTLPGCSSSPVTTHTPCIKHICSGCMLFNFPSLADGLLSCMIAQRTVCYHSAGLW